MSTPLIDDLATRLARVESSPAASASERMTALNELAWELRSLDPPRANALATDARKIAIEMKDKLGQARAARTMAMTVADADQLRNVFHLADEARRLFDEVGDAYGQAGSRDFLASIHEFIGDYAGGLEFALEALSIAREINNPIRQGYALSSVGGILAASGEVEAGIERLQEALLLFEEAEDATGVGTICSRLSRVFKDSGRKEEALRFAERSRDASWSDNPYMTWVAHTVKAEIEEERGDSEQAEMLHREALACLHPEPARALFGGETQVALGRLLLKRGAFEEAEAELKDALSRVQGNSVSVLVETSIHEVLADIYERQARPSDALEHLRAAMKLREQLSQRDARNKLTQVEVRASMDAAKKNAELHRLRFVELHGMQSKLVEAEKMALLGQLAAGTAHELNSPLGVLRSNASLMTGAVERLLSCVPPESAYESQIRTISTVLQSCQKSTLKAVERIGAIADSFKRFSQLDQAERRPFDVREGLDSALTLLEPTVPDGVRFERRFEPVPPIEGWLREVNHAFLTVLRNAAQAIEKEGVVTAETDATEEHVRVRIHDTGRGMTQEEVASLFDVSWSVDEGRTQMRLGLSAAYATVQKHGGTIEVTSTPGRGTRFTFLFPRNR